MSADNGQGSRHRRADRRQRRPTYQPPSRGGTRRDSAGGSGIPRQGAQGPRPGDREVAARLVAEALHRVRAHPTAAAACAWQLTGPAASVAPRLVAEALATVRRSTIVAVLGAGWLPSDLAELTRRRLTPRHLPTLAAVLAAEADRHPADRVAPAWRQDLAGLGRPGSTDPTYARDLELLLGLLGMLSGLPRIGRLLPPPGSVEAAAGPLAGGDTRVLAKVRALLAKAEATDYPEEAEALSAKAQELVSRYALGRLADRAAHSAQSGDFGHSDAATGAITSRRLWIDAPYVLAKAMLIDTVAAANRCRTVVSDQIGFTTVVGEADDLEAVEVLATSLLVQADLAMLRHGRQTDRRGGSRTTSFRRAFLVSYATRIGERLRAATEEATAGTGCSAELVPVLRRQAERVDAACAEMFPHLETKQTRVSNADGWAAGRSAADRARLDAHAEVTEAAG